MPIPAAWSTIPITWDLFAHTGNACNGVVVFTSDQVVTVDGDTFVPEPISVKVTDGVMAAVSLPSTDDPDINPTGWTWKVTALTSPPGPAPFNITVPAATVGSINLATVVPVASPTPLTSTAIGDQFIAGRIDDTDSATRVAADAVFAAKQGGSLALASFVTGDIDTTGATDYTTEVTTALAALDALGGGTLLLPSGSVLCAGQLALPKGNRNTNGMWRMNPITIRGTAGHAAGQKNRGTGGSRLLLTYQGDGSSEDAAIVSQGEGVLSFKNIILQDTTAGSATPFLYTTGTTVKVDNSVAVIGADTGTAVQKDFWVAGGTLKFPVAPVTADPDNYGSLLAPFQGYGSSVIGAYFNGVRRIVYGRSYANQIVVSYNFFDKDCGTNLAGGACVEFDGSLTDAHPGDSCAANVIVGNYFENNNYVYGVKIKKGGSNIVAFNGFEDSGPAFLACIRLEGHTIGGTDYPTVATYIAGNFANIYDLVSYDAMSARPSSLNMISHAGRERSTFPAGVQLHADSYTVGLGGRGLVALDTNGHGAYVLAVVPASGSVTEPRVALATKPAKSVTDGVLINGSTIFESASAVFVAADVGFPIGGTGIQSGTVIAKRNSATEVVLSLPATATATGATVTWGRVGTEAKQVTFDRQRLVAEGNAPTIAAGAAAGTSPTVAIAGRDLSGSVTVTTGTSPTTGVLATITYAKTSPGTTRIVVSPADAGSGALAGWWADRLSSTQWRIHCTVAPPASTALKFNYVTVDAA